MQADPSNPLPCSEADKKKYPKGQMPETAATAAPVIDAGAPTTTEDEDLEALIKGGEAGAPKTTPAPGQESDEDLEALIKGGTAKDAGEADGAPSKPAPKPGQESDDDLLEMIKGNKK